MKNKKTFLKFLFLPAIGFGIGGLFWGWECYKINSQSIFSLTGAFLLGIFGSVGVLISVIKEHNLDKKEKSKLIIKVIGGGACGVGLGFLTVYIFNYPLYLIGNVITVLISFLSLVSHIEEWKLNNFIFTPSFISIAYFWVHFFIIGAISFGVYGFLLKIKKKPLVWKGFLAGIVASFISPVTANILPISLLYKYLVNFTLIGFIFGLFLGWGIWRSKNVRRET